MHVREGAQALEERHVDGPELAHLSEVVPLEVHDHHVLRGILLAFQELPREGVVPGWRGTSWPRALDRPRLDLAAPDEEEALGARAQEMMVSRIEEAAERRRRAHAQGFVGRPARAHGSASRNSLKVRIGSPRVDPSAHGVAYAARSPRLRNQPIVSDPRTE